MTKFIYLFILAILPFGSFAQNDSLAVDPEAALHKILERDKQIKYQTGAVEINSDVKLNVPTGYKFMPKADAEYVVFDFWGNPKQDGLLGLIVKDDYSIANADNWAFVVTYDKSGFVKDEDAADINYDDMMEQMKEDEVAENEQRVKDGYSAVYMIGWAAKPFYDKKNNILHWAKSLKFGDTATDTTLNYDVRILGRRGVLSLNAVGSVSQIADIKTHIPDIIHIAKFNEGSRYIDFDPSVDQVAAYTIGGLVAGKLLAKAGLLALLLKNIKLILLALGVFFGGFRNKIAGLFGKKKPEDTNVAASDATENESAES